ncbi:putative cytosol aminopeptidase [Bienertia sinuspersici]
MGAAAKIIQTSFNNTINFLHIHPTFKTNTLRKLCSLSICRSTSNDSSSSGSQPEGDLKKQELLAKIAMLQTQKIRLTDYLDERSSYLTQFAEEANAEIDAIGENALKDLDEASARIMENIESKMQEFEESSEMSKEEIAKSEKELTDFEGAIDTGRNEGLFFKSLQQKKPVPVDRAKAKEEAKKVNDITKGSAASKVRRNIYLALMGLMAVAIADSYISPSPDLPKLAVLAAIFVGLLSQFIYEQNLFKETENQEKEDNDDEKR